jgi:hypothetical protein
MSDEVVRKRLHEISTIPGQLDEAKAGSEEARRALAQRYSVAIYSYLLKVVGDDAAEVLVAVHERLAAYAENFVPGQGHTFRVYLKTCVRNAARNFLRRPKAAPGVDLSSVAEPSAPDEPGRALADDMRKKILHRALTRLTQHERGTRGGLPAELLRGFGERLERDEAEPISLADDADTVGGAAPPAVRQRVRRARDLVAEALVEEVKATFLKADVTADELQDELAELGLVDFVRRSFAADD